MTGLNQALNQWQKILGEKNIIFEKNKLNNFQKTTFSSNKKILAVIFPKNKKDIQDSLKIANKYKIPVYPISTGKNWGYGSMVPTSDSVIMNLVNMSKILEFNEELGYTTIEPGVTFAQLDRYLMKKKSNLIMSNMGGSPDSSLIGNFIERGIGKGEYGNKYDTAANLEIILPSGDCIYSGEKNFLNSKNAETSRETIGPEITGLFTQSNFGIVTRMTLWLKRKPNYSENFIFFVNSHLMEKTIDILRSLKLEKTITGNLLISNEYRMISSFQQYPWKESKGEVPLSERLLDKLKKKWKIVGNWGGKITIEAISKEELELKKRRLSLSFSGLSNIIFFFEKKSSPEHPTDFAIRSLYWRKKNPIPKNMDPDLDRCGGLWISPLVPFTGKAVMEVVKLMNRTMRSYKFEPNLGINCLTDRKVNVTGAILFDRNEKSQDKKAIDCYKEIYKKLIKTGNLPYRLGIVSMYDMPKPKREFIKFIKKIKNVLDPNDILAPGRYDYRKYW